MRVKVLFFDFQKKIINKFIQSRVQFSKYFIIGVSSLLLDIISLFVFKQYLGIKPTIAVIFNQFFILNYVFLLNKYWSFGTRGMGHRQVVRFYILAGFNYLFSIAWMFVLNEQFNMNYLLTRIINIALAVSWNFVLYKKWVYKK